MLSGNLSVLLARNKQALAHEQVCFAVPCAKCAAKLVSLRFSLLDLQHPQPRLPAIQVSHTKWTSSDSVDIPRSGQALPELES